MNKTECRVFIAQRFPGWTNEDMSVISDWEADLNALLAMGWTLAFVTFVPTVGLVHHLVRTV